LQSATASISGEASAKAAAQEMKVKLDAMRDELAAERSRNQDLLDVVEKLVKLLRGTQASADRLDDVTDGYSNALTQLLTPDTPA
jgi:phosphoenolpyruvate-protein kinase (PTS system EI component)